MQTLVDAWCDELDTATRILPNLSMVLLQCRTGTSTQRRQLMMSIARLAEGLAQFDCDEPTLRCILDADTADEEETDEESTADSDGDEHAGADAASQMVDVEVGSDSDHCCADAFDDVMNDTAAGAVVVRQAHD